MTGRTHREFSILFTCVAIMLVYYYCISDINYYGVYIIMTSVGIQGGLFPDVDHAWKNVKEKTVINWVINKIIHMTGGTHRSRHTHSVEIWLGSGLAALYMLNSLQLNSMISAMNYQIALIIVLAFYSGWGSHLFSDALTIGCIFLFGKKIKFVPRSIGKGDKKIVFNTGNEWEIWVYKKILKVNTIVTIITLLFPILSSKSALLLYRDLSDIVVYIVMCVMEIVMKMVR